MIFFNRLSRLVILASITLILSACGSLETLLDVPSQKDSARVEPYNLELHQRSIHIFDPIDINQRVVVSRLEPRVDNLYLILDQSSAMSGEYRKIDLQAYAREITRRFLETMPEHRLGGGFWVLDERKAPVELQDLRFDHSAYESQLSNNLTLTAIGSSDLAKAIDRVSSLIHSKQERSALLIVSRWDQIDRSVQEAVMRLREHRIVIVDGFGQESRDQSARLGEAVCVFTLGVGNRLSRTQLDEPDSCGFSAAADKVAQPWDMAHFVERVLFRGPADTDRDGVFDHQDQCPNTDENRIVDRQGCPYFAPARVGSLGR